MDLRVTPEPQTSKRYAFEDYELSACLWVGVCRRTQTIASTI